MMVTQSIIRGLWIVAGPPEHHGSAEHWSR